MSVPIYIARGRAGFGTQHTLAYRSSADDELYGLDWHISVPLVAGETGKGLPRSEYADGSDVFNLSGAVDLAPVLKQSGDQSHWETSALETLHVK